ncbi:MAG: 6-carboxytetrahydropterin synthase [bacterium]|nr:6-carboxytetrahydropterin synthase [bacterium]
MYTITKELKEIPMGHRLAHHHGMCRFLHGHNYKVMITVQAKELDEQGMVMDFGLFGAFQAILNGTYDHSFMMWSGDKLLHVIQASLDEEFRERIVVVPFHPTAENIARLWCGEFAKFLLDKVGKRVRIYEFLVYETENSCASVEYP